MGLFYYICFMIKVNTSSTPKAEDNSLLVQLEYGSAPKPLDRLKSGFYYSHRNKWISIIDLLSNEIKLLVTKYTKVKWGDITGELSNQKDLQSALDSISSKQTLQTIKVTVTSAEILDAYDTPVELIPAPAAGFYIDPISVMWYIDFQTTPYDTNTKWSLYFGNQNILTANNSVRFLDNTTGRKYKEQTSQPFQVAPTALTFFVQDGNPTAGDSDLIIFITYQLVEL